MPVIVPRSPPGNLRGGANRARRPVTSRATRREKCWIGDGSAARGLLLSPGWVSGGEVSWVGCSVAELAAAADDVLLELGPDGVVDRRGDGLPGPLPGDLGGRRGCVGGPRGGPS